jgi:protein TonB
MAQTDEVDDAVFVVVEKSPEFPGGDDSLYTFIGRNIKYPEAAKKNKIEGRVFVTFVIEKDGQVSSAKILRDIGGGCGEEALRVVNSMPKWKPGTQRGNPVRVQFNLPIMFQLQKQTSDSK